MPSPAKRIADCTVDDLVDRFWGGNSIAEAFTALRDATRAEALAESAERVAELERANAYVGREYRRERDLHEARMNRVKELERELTALRASRESDVRDAKREGEVNIARRVGAAYMTAPDDALSEVDAMLAIIYQVADSTCPLPLPAAEPPSVVVQGWAFEYADGVWMVNRGTARDKWLTLHGALYRASITPTLDEYAALLALATGAER